MQSVELSAESAERAAPVSAADGVCCLWELLSLEKLSSLCPFTARGLVLFDPIVSPKGAWS